MLLNGTDTPVAIKQCVNVVTDTEVELFKEEEYAMKRLAIRPHPNVRRPNLKIS